jgi:beta-fructofuranosidase
VNRECSLVPVQANDFVRVYKPEGDTFSGPDTEHLKEGEWYHDWVPNDHCFVKADDGKWHIFGITHPFVDVTPLQDGIHEGEYASFHAVSSADRFSETLEEGHYADLPKVLPPSERPGEIPQNHAPYTVRKDGLYQMVYGHSPIRLAVSPDLMKWTPKDELFSDPDGARDPNLLHHDGTYYLVYCSLKSVRLTKSKDLVHWSEPVTILSTGDFDPESPSLIKNQGSFYLFVCSWDGVWDGKEVQGAYQHKTYVYCSSDPHDFGIDGAREIATLNAHAPEILRDEDGQWYISSVEWPNRGVSVDKLNWTARR